jgi:hypothetical protein
VGERGQGQEQEPEPVAEALTERVAVEDGTWTKVGDEEVQSVEIE